MSFVLFYIFLILPIMYAVKKVRSNVKPSLKAWLIAKAQTRPNLMSALRNPLLKLYVTIFTNSMFISTMIFFQLMVGLNVIPAQPPDWVQLYAITFSVMGFAIVFPIMSDAKDGKGIFAETETPIEQENKA